MKRDTMNYSMVGLFVLAMGVALMVVLYQVTGRTGPTENYYLELNNVGGLKFGTQVAYEGYRIGQVLDIEPQHAESGTRYRVTLGVERGWRIPANSRAEVVASGLISAMSINVREGDSPEALAPGDTIAHQPRSNMFADISGAAQEFSDLSRDGIAPLLVTLNQRINDVADEVVALRRDDLSPMLANIDTQLDEEIFTRVGSTLVRLDRTLAAVEQVLREENIQRIDSALAGVAEAAGGLHGLLDGVEETRQDMNDLIAEVDGLVQRASPRVDSTLRQLDNTGRYLESSARSIAGEMDGIMYNLATTSRNMSEFSRAIRDNPSRVLRSSSAQEDE